MLLISMLKHLPAPAGQVFLFEGLVSSSPLKCDAAFSGPITV
jgi:hypothetical protein